MKARIAVSLALLAGLLQTASFAPTEAWWLQIASLGLLAFAAHDARARRAALLGWLFGLAWFCSGLWWIFISLHRYGGMPAALAAIAVLLLGAGLALYYALALAVWARWRGPPQACTPARAAAGYAACWTLAELARGVLFTGFPWIAGGYAHTSGPLAAWAPWAGVYGIGALAAWLGAALGLLLVPAATGARRRRNLPLAPLLHRLAPPGVFALLALAAPHDFTRDAGALSVTLLQPATAQDEKFDPAHVEGILRWHVQALAQSRGTLVLTPESSIPLPLGDLDNSFVEALRQPFARGERGLLVGMFLGDDRQGYTNSLLGLSAASDLERNRAYRYGKHHLLPFGEFIPPGFRWFVDLMHIPIGDQARGHGSTPFAVGGQRVRPLICYEDLFGEDIVDSVVGPDAATVFANATNLAWFGHVMVQDQHLQASRMRALEFQRPMVRATNTGITGVVDHRGVLRSRLPADTAGVLEAQVRGRAGATPYAMWLSRTGLWPLALGALAVLLTWRRAQGAAS